MTAHFPHAFDQRTDAGVKAPATLMAGRPNGNVARSTAWLAIGYFIAASISLVSTRIDGDIAYCWIATALLMPRLGICVIAIVGGVLTLPGHGRAVLASKDHWTVALFFQFYLALTVATLLPMVAELTTARL